MAAFRYLHVLGLAALCFPFIQDHALAQGVLANEAMQRAPLPGELKRIAGPLPPIRATTLPSASLSRARIPRSFP